MGDDAKIALAGPEEAPETATPESPSMADALSGDFAVPAPIPFTKQVADATNSAAANNPKPNVPGSWSRSLLGGVMDALSGFVQGGGAGQQAAENQNRILARKDELRQQAINNQRAQTQQQREGDIAKATIAHENIATTFDEMNVANLGAKRRADSVTTGSTSIQPYLTAGAPVIQEGLDSTQLQALLAQKKLSPGQQHAFPTGQAPVLDKDGHPEMDKDGVPLMRPTYTVVGDVPEVTLDGPTAQMISANTQYKFTEGQKLSGLVYGTVIQQAKSAMTAQAAVDEQLEKAGIEKANLEETAAAQRMKPDWNNALAHAGGNVKKAVQYLQSDPKMKQKYPDAESLVANLYQGQKNLNDVMDSQQKLIDTEEEQRQKRLQGGDYKGNPDAASPQEFLASLSPDERAVVQLIGEGKAPINKPDYLLARKPEVLGAVAKAYPGFDESKVSSYQKAYADYTSGDVSKQLISGATAFEHLKELQQLNTNMSRVPTTAAKQAYDNKVATVAAELARFYGNTTEQGIESYKDTLSNFFNRNAAIETQVKSMGDRMDNLQQEWVNAAPSKAYQAPMPGISSAAKKSRAALDPDYANRTISVQIPGAQPGYIKEYLLDDFMAAYPDAKVNR